MKKVLAMAVAVCMVLSMLPALSLAEAGDEYSYTATGIGHSGGATGTGIFIGAVGGTGTSTRAPFISGVTGNRDTVVSSARIGAIAFEVDGNLDPESIVGAEMKVYVNSVNQNLGDDWMLLAAYETANPALTYAIGGMDESRYAAVNNDYSYDAAFWSNEILSRSNTGWKTLDVRRAVVNALKADGGKSSKVRVVLRIQAPAAGLNISTTGEVPYLTVKTGVMTSVNINTVYMDGETEVYRSTDTVSGIAVGETYNHTVPANTVEYEGTIYLYNAEASTMSTVAAPDGTSQINVVYKKYDLSLQFSGYEVDDEGAWCWFADPRSISYKNEDGTLDFSIIGYIDVHGSIKATQIDYVTNEVKEVLIRSNIQPDDHNNPTFLVLPDERIIVFYSRHTDEPCFWYRVTKEKGDLATLGEEKCLNTNDNTTYPSPFLMENDPDNIYLCWRGIGWHPTIAKLSLPDEDGNVHFTYGPYQMVQSTGARPYAKYSSNGVDKIYLTYTTGHPDNEHPNWVYFNQIDIATMTLEDVNGNTMSTIKDGKLYVNREDGTQSNIVDKPGDMRDWVWQVATGNDGYPVIAMVRINGGKSSHDYYYVKWNGSKWVTTFLANGGGSFHQSPGLEMCYSGGMAIDPENTNIVYCSQPVWGDFGKVYEIVKYTMSEDGTRVLSSEPITKNSQKNNVRPFVIPNSSDKDIRLIWMHGDYYDWIVSNAYTTQGFCTSVVAENPLFENDVVDITAMAEDDYRSIGGAYFATKNSGRVLSANAQGEFSVTADIYMDGSYEGRLLDLGDVKLSVKNMATQYGANAAGDRARVVVTVGDEEYATSNVYGSSDCWTSFGRGTGGNYAVENYGGYVNHTITYDGEKLTLYRDGLIDITIPAEGLSLNNVTVGGFEGSCEYVAAFDRVLNRDEIKALCETDYDVKEPSESGKEVVKRYIDIDGTEIKPAETYIVYKGTDVFIPDAEVVTENYIYAFEDTKGDFDFTDGEVTQIGYRIKEFDKNIMTNPSFEDENGNFSLAGWLSAETNNQFGSPYSTDHCYAVSSTAAISKNQSSSLSTTIPDGNWAFGSRWNDGKAGLCSLKRYVKVESGKSYIVSYKVKHKTGADGGYLVTSLVANEGDDESVATSTAPGYIGTEWTSVTRRFTATDSTDYVLFWFRWLGAGGNPGNGPYWFFDDFSIREIVDFETTDVTFDNESVKTYGKMNLGEDGELPKGVMGYIVMSGNTTKFVGAGELNVNDGDIIATADTNIKMVTGAQVRIGKGVDSNGTIIQEGGSGLRFIAEIDRSNFDDAEFTYGMEITAENSSNVADVPAEYYQDAGCTIFTAAITNLNPSNYNRNYTALPYVNVTYADGTTAKIYAEKPITRSVYQVAAGLLKKGYTQEDNGTAADKTGTDYTQMPDVLVNVLNAYVNRVGIRLNFTQGEFSARIYDAENVEETKGGYRGTEAFFEITGCEKDGNTYRCKLTPYGKAVINTDNDFYRQNIRINNNNAGISTKVTITPNEDGTYTLEFKL